MTDMDISLPGPMRDWVRSRVESGRYASVDDYLRDLIRRDQMESEEREALIAALVAGEDSGVSGRNVPEIFAALKEELGGAQEPSPGLESRDAAPSPVWERVGVRVAT